MGSSLPRHDARTRTKTQNRTKKNRKKKKKKKGRLQVSTKKYIYRKKIYMMHEQVNVMMHALM